MDHASDEDVINGTGGPARPMLQILKLNAPNRSLSFRFSP